MREQTNTSPAPALTPEETVMADKGYRAVILGVYGLTAVFGFIAIRYLIPSGLSYLRTLGWKELLQTLRLVFILLLLSFSPAAIYVIVIGRRILRHDCWPYPGRKVMFDTKVLHGEEARSRGKLMIALGTVFLVLMVASVAYVYIRYTGWLRSPLLKEYLFHEEVVLRVPAAQGRESAGPESIGVGYALCTGTSFSRARRRIFPTGRSRVPDAPESSIRVRAGPSGPGC